MTLNSSTDINIILNNLNDEEFTKLVESHKRKRQLLFTSNLPVDSNKITYSDTYIISTNKINYTNKVDINNYDYFLFDCDGVLWRGNDLIPGADRIINLLNQMGKQVIFVTNNSSKSRKQYLKKFQDMNIYATYDQIISSSYAAAYYLFSKKFNKTVLSIGEPGIGLEMEEFNINHISASKLFGTTLLSSKELDAMIVDPDIGAVVAGIDPNFTYTKLAYALKSLNNSNCEFIATNMDNSYPSPGGLLPGGGSIVTCISYASNRTPDVMGKPESLMLSIIIEKFKINPERSIMIGDKLETDILFGKQGGMDTALVLTGVSSVNDINKTGITPKFVLSSVDELI